MKIEVVAYGTDAAGVERRFVLGDVVVAADDWLSGVPEGMMMDLNLSFLLNEYELVIHRRPVVGEDSNDPEPGP